MKIFVPDASIILKWVLGEDEEGQDRAIELLNGWLDQEHEIILPSLWIYEVGNVLGVKRTKDAEKILGLLLGYEFKESRITDIQINLTFHLMKEFKGVTFYDAIYHALALIEKGVMVTADKDYFKKTKDKGGIMLI